MENLLIFNTSDDFKEFVGKDEFEVSYRKTNGRFSGLRKGRLGVTEDSKGNKLVKGTKDEEQKDFANVSGDVPYFEEGKDGYRQFNIHRMNKLKVRGQTYDFGL